MYDITAEGETRAKEKRKFEDELGGGGTNNENKINCNDKRLSNWILIL